MSEALLADFRLFCYLNISLPDILNLNKLPNNPSFPDFRQLLHTPLQRKSHLPKPLPMRHEQDVTSFRRHPNTEFLPLAMTIGHAQQFPIYIMP